MCGTTAQVITASGSTMNPTVQESITGKTDAVSRASGVTVNAMDWVSMTGLTKEATLANITMK